VNRRPSVDSDEKQEHTELVIHDGVAMSVADAKKQVTLGKIDKIVSERREHLLANVGYGHGNSRTQELLEIESELRELRRGLIRRFL
jgi:hypothetical protein